MLRLNHMFTNECTEAGVILWTYYLWMMMILYSYSSLHYVLVTDDVMNGYGKLHPSLIFTAWVFGKLFSLHDGIYNTQASVHLQRCGIKEQQRVLGDTSTAPMAGSIIQGALSRKGLSMMGTSTCLLLQP